MCWWLSSNLVGGGPGNNIFLGLKCWWRKQVQLRWKHPGSHDSATANDASALWEWQQAGRLLTSQWHASSQKIFLVAQKSQSGPLLGDCLVYFLEWQQLPQHLVTPEVAHVTLSVIYCTQEIYDNDTESAFMSMNTHAHTVYVRQRFILSTNMHVCASSLSHVHTHTHRHKHRCIHMQYAWWHMACRSYSTALLYQQKDILENTNWILHLHKTPTNEKMVHQHKRECTFNKSGDISIIYMKQYNLDSSYRNMQEHITHIHTNIHACGAPRV